MTKNKLLLCEKNPAGMFADPRGLNIDLKIYIFYILCDTIVRIKLSIQQYPLVFAGGCQSYRLQFETVL